LRNARSTGTLIAGQSRRPSGHAISAFGIRGKNNSAFRHDLGGERTNTPAMRPSKAEPRFTRPRASSFAYSGFAV
jgi:hypothetical protein